jgi:hypothetical protein
MLRWLALQMMLMIIRRHRQVSHDTIHDRMLVSFSLTAEVGMFAVRRQPAVQQHVLRFLDSFEFFFAPYLAHVAEEVNLYFYFYLKSLFPADI